MLKPSYVGTWLLGMTIAVHAQSPSYKLESWDESVSGCAYSVDADGSNTGMSALVDRALTDAGIFTDFQDNQYLKRSKVMATRFADGKYKLSFIVVDHSYNEYGRVTGETRYPVSGNIVVDTDIKINISYNRWFGALPVVKLLSCDPEKERLDDWEIYLGDIIDDVTVEFVTTLTDNIGGAFGEVAGQIFQDWAENDGKQRAKAVREAPPSALLKHNQRQIQARDMCNQYARYTGGCS